jgi:hypothetical protein
MAWMDYRRKLRCESDLQYDLLFAGKQLPSGRKTNIQAPATPISPRLLSKFQRTYMRTGAVFKSSLEQHQLILSCQQIRPLFARDGMAGVRPRSELPRVDSGRNAKHLRCWWSRRPYLFDARQRPRCDWRGREGALLRPQLPPDRIGRFLLQPFQDRGSGVGGLGLDRQMKMLGHERPADRREMPILPHFLKTLDQTATESVGEEECRATIAEGKNEGRGIWINADTKGVSAPAGGEWESFALRARQRMCAANGQAFNADD